MNARAAALDGVRVTVERRDAEFAARLADSSNLAFRVAYSVVRHKEDAEDIAQEAFARAHARFAQLREPERFRSWLVRIVWRLALDARRAAQRRGRREAVSVVPRPPSVEDMIAERERSERLWRAIDALPENLRIVIVLATIEEHDLPGVARLLGIPEGTVKSRLHSARQRLREHLS